MEQRVPKTISQVWRPNSTFLINKIERVQLRAVKWILAEQNNNYSKEQYFKKCKELDLLPLKTRIDFFLYSSFPQNHT